MERHFVSVYAWSKNVKLQQNYSQRSFSSLSEGDYWANEALQTRFDPIWFYKMTAWCF